MAKHAKIYEKNYKDHVGATFNLITTFLGLVFLSCGAPLGMLIDRRSEDPQYNQRCYTLWGERPNCWNAEYSWRVSEETCHDKRRRFEAAEAFIVTALFSLLMQILFLYYQLCDTKSYKTINVLFALFSLGCTTVPWAVVTAFYYTPFCGEDTLTKTNLKFASGYAVTVTSFALQALGAIILICVEPDAETQNGRLRRAAEEKNRAALEDADDVKAGKKKKDDTSSSSSSD